MSSPSVVYERRAWVLVLVDELIIEGGGAKKERPSAVTAGPLPFSSAWETDVLPDILHHQLVGLLRHPGVHETGEVERRGAVEKSLVVDELVGLLGGAEDDEDKSKRRELAASSRR